tara:strand:+ start:833 stop:3172 length:2340 start_codon:yes stop_codon:yes gene_type:complete
MKKKILVSSILIFVVICFATIKIFFSEYCVNPKIIKAAKDLNYIHLKTCFSKGNMEHNIKKILIKHPTLYEFARKIKKKYYSGTTKDLLNIEFSKIQIDNKKKYINVKGLLSSNATGKKYFDEKESYIENSTWLRSHGGNWNTHYSSSDLISKKNIKRLKLLWKNESIAQSKLEKDWIQNIEVNPIVINKKIIYVTADWKIIALNALSGKKIWQIQSIFQPARRGLVAYADQKNNKEYLFLPISGKIFKVDAITGKIIKSFGNKGSVNSLTSIAPMIYKDNLVVGSIYRAIEVFDLNTGEEKFSVSLHNNRNFSGAAPWGGVALDETKGLVFIVTGNPMPALYGVNRPGDNKNSSSIIAIDLKSKKVLWTFQDVSHDLWDYDIASPPIIHNLKIDNKLFEVVITLTKTGNVLVLERNSGKPIFDLRYKKAPKSDVPNEIVSNYQLDLEKPEKFSKIQYGKGDYNQLPKNKIKEIEKLLINSKFGWFEPPSFNKDLIMFGLHGGAQWPGAALDPINHELYIPTNNVPWKLRPYLQSMETSSPRFLKDKSALNLYYNKCASCHGKKRNGIFQKKGEKITKYIPSLIGLVGDESFRVFEKKYFTEKFYKSHGHKFLNNKDFNKLNNLFKEWDQKLNKHKLIRVESNSAWSQFLTSDDLPASNPPWGYIAKIDLKTGKIVWKKPVGKKIIDNKLVETGSSIFGGVALNKNGILFVTGTDDNFIYALDSKTGNILWEYKMKASGSAPPTIYKINGKEYLSVISSGGQYHNYKNKDSTMYTFSLN